MAEGGGGGLGFDGRGRWRERGFLRFLLLDVSAATRSERGALGLWSMAVHFRWHADVDRRRPRVGPSARPSVRRSR